MIDILIRNGQIIDGSGNPRYAGDVAIEGDRITKIGRLESAQASLVIDAAGCVVSPGFVDMHSHSDFSLPLIPTSDSMVQQGITTEVVGNCGFSPAPLIHGRADGILALMANVDAGFPTSAWKSFGEYLQFLAKLRTSTNVAPLVGHGMVRNTVMGFSADKPTPAQLARMQGEVARALDEGAVGVSTGLVYPPACYATTEEIIEIVRPAGQRGSLYFSHIRGEDERLPGAVSEAIRIGRETGAAVQVSHFKSKWPRNWSQSAVALELMDRARSDGFDVSADMYTYAACSNWVADLLPEWAREGGKEVVMARLKDTSLRGRMSREIEATSDEDLGKVLICEAPRRRTYEGRTIIDLAEEAGKSPLEWVYDALLETDLDMSRIMFAMCEDNIVRQLQWPWMMIGTDGSGAVAEGPLAQGKPHPRSFGTYPRLLGRYVREQSVISLEEAVHMATGRPARKLRLRDRGLIEPRNKADIVIFDPATIIDRATFENPHQYPVGIRAVLVNGVIVVRDGVHSGARPGKVLACHG